MKRLSCLLMIIVSLWSCGDDVTNYYLVPERQPNEQPDVFEPGKWITDMVSLSYYGLRTDLATLHPAYILQAEGVRQMHPKSRFAQQMVTEGMGMSIVNPGIGTRICLKMEEGDIYHASEYSYTVQATDTADTLRFDIPVNWNYNVLRTWENDNMVCMQWDLELNGCAVQHYKKNFDCRSIHCFRIITTEKKVSDETAAREEMGDYPYTLNGDTLLVYNSDFLAGFIDENSPAIERLKKEVVSDGYLQYFWGHFSPTPSDMLESVDAFAYLMQKYHIVYGSRDAADYQYIRNIDAVFGNRQGYCIELAVAFASWCLNIGVDVSYDNVPSHATNRVYFDDKSYAIDFTPLAAVMGGASKFSSPVTEEEKECARYNFNILMNLSTRIDTEVYEPGREAGYVEYYSFRPADIRKYLPSFNMGSSYTITRSLESPKQIKPLSPALWQ